jgi:hypothetical protein
MCGFHNIQLLVVDSTDKSGYVFCFGNLQECLFQPLPSQNELRDAPLSTPSRAVKFRVIKIFSLWPILQSSTFMRTKNKT